MAHKRSVACSALALAFAAQLGLGETVHAADKAPPPEANAQVLVKATIRPKPVDAPPPLEDYTHLPKYELMALSPDASEIAFLTTFENQHFLVVSRIADKTKRMVKLDTGDISAITFADNDHVLVTASRPGLRGTCATGAEGNGQKGADDQSNLIAATVDPSADSAAQTATAAAAMTLLNSIHPPGCIYFGVREQNAVTSVNMAAGTGETLGDKLSENNNLALGTPAVLTLDGKPQLVGPFMELRAVSVGNQPAQRVYLWRADPDTGVGKMIDDGGGDEDRENRYVDDWLVDPQGTILARTVYDYTSAVFSLQMKIDGKWKAVLTRKIVDKDHTVAPYLAGLGRDGQSIVIIDKATDGSGFSHYYELSPDGSLSAPLEPGDAARDRPVFSPQTGRLAGFLQHGETDSYALSDPDLTALYQNAQDAVPGETVRIVSTASDPRKMIIYAAGGEDPGAYYYIDFGTGQTATIGEDYPEVPTDWVASQHPMTYTAADGLEIHALLTLPPRPAAKNLPLIVLPHDGPQDHDALGFDWLAQALASRGYLVLQPNYRGSDGYGDAFMTAGYGQWGRKMQSDLSDGVAALVAQGLADPKRVCIVGQGYGGYATLTAAATQPDVYRCAGAINGISDVAGFSAWQKDRQALPEQDAMTNLLPDPSWPRAFVANPESSQILNSYLGGGTTSPVQQAASIRMPVLLVDGDHDFTVPARQSQAMAQALGRYSLSATLVEVKGGDHALSTEDARLQTVTAVLDFLARNNPAN